MTVITNSEALTPTTFDNIIQWMTNNNITNTYPMTLSFDEVGFVKEFDIGTTLTTPQIDNFKQTFFNKRNQGNKGSDVASASTLTLSQGNLITITGTTTINYITTTNWKPGSTICLDFAANITLNHNEGSVPVNTAALYLTGQKKADFNANSTLTLIYNGTYWLEIGRMKS